MKLYIEIDLANDAFQGHTNEVHRILARAADRIAVRILENDLPCGEGLWDVNGNTVGQFDITED